MSCQVQMKGFCLPQYLEHPYFQKRSKHLVIKITKATKKERDMRGTRRGKNGKGNEELQKGCKEVDEDVDERVWREGCVAQATRGKPILTGPEMPALSNI